MLISIISYSVIETVQLLALKALNVNVIISRPLKNLVENTIQ